MIFLKLSQRKGIQAKINERQHPDSQKKLTQHKKLNCCIKIKHKNMK